MAEANALTTIDPMIAPANANSSRPRAASGNELFGGRLEPLRQFAAQPALQRALPAIATTSAIGIAALAWFLTQSAPQTPLFSGLADSDKGAVVEALRTSGIKHRVDPITGSVTVDADQLHQARMALASQGLPKAQPTGDSMIASLPMGSSRAVEGETLRGAKPIWRVRLKPLMPCKAPACISPRPNPAYSSAKINPPPLR